ncbi:tripartite-type tricarboxylate transporter receptor subunit TctC [Variovorax boronicumulans]|nr:tripartite tricarboxylate transporter substrate binding protein [Variovorax boronicumulans]MDP9994540.1 tripartite-type tricarboxylate transporter receptor subunit TctC [Variovorax boronicumulans]MDQ0005761.1 tripartite-type tricarboxylate transporter receptor subunit TctC [Variovorax boronicumulans]MDQ0044395.1 tripartite-type tricarboxylate transporter receptor subunit TctC [Variovorax boronicumulans]
MTRDRSCPRRREALAALGLSLLGLPASAQSGFPNKPIRLVVSYPAGGLATGQLTILQQKLLQSTGANLVLDYRPGASGNIGVDIVLKSPPDGYTIDWAGMGSFAIIPRLLKKLPYDLSKDIQYITPIGTIANVLVVHPSIPANKLRELAELSRKQDLFYALTSVGSTMHLAMESNIAGSGLKISSVPYKGDTPAFLDVVPGRVPVMLNTVPGVLQYMRSGTLKALAVTTAERSEQLPDVPRSRNRDSRTLTSAEPSYSSDRPACRRPPSTGSIGSSRARSTAPMPERRSLSSGPKPSRCRWPIRPRWSGPKTISGAHWSRSSASHGGEPPSVFGRRPTDRLRRGHEAAMPQHHREHRHWDR